MGHTRQVGGCQTDAGELVLLGEGCAVVQPSYQSYRIVEDEFGRSDSSGRLLDSVHNTMYHG